MSKHFHVKKDDQVMVMVGKERGKTGKILRVVPKKERVIVEKVNFVKRHTRPSAHQRQGGILEKEAPIHVSNVMIVCTKCNSPVRVGHKALEDGKKVRYCKKCGEFIDL
ncbi:MAG: 50S ribosomal protein L24 [Deltaproteobacteria bacterium DG_8]|nr:MAG: 50S ribosomal protein L24 [Deltaproteobacteria bacterium DG_8]